MLYWICPECGHECSPAIRECPTCTAPPETRANASRDLLSLAQNFQSAPSTGLLMAPTGSTIAAAVAIQEPKEPELASNLAPLDNLAVKPIRPARLEAVKLSPAPVPVRISSPVVAPSTAPAPVQFGLEPAGPAPAGEIGFKPARGVLSAAIAESAQPLPSRRQAVAFVRAELPVPDHSGISVANLAQMSEAQLKPVLPHQNATQQNGQPKNGISQPLAYQPLPGKPSLAPSQLKLTGESLADLLHALKISNEELDRVGIGAIQAAFGQQPALRLLPAPAEIVTAPAPPAAQWMHSRKPKFTSIAPDDRPSSAVFAGPQAPPLAGPSLPPQLLNFDHQNSSLRPNRGRMPSWPISLLLATILILGVVGLYQYFSQDRDTTAASVAAPTTGIAQATKAAPAPHAPVVAEHPAARSVEVAGVRIVTGPNKKLQLQYIVINHSSNELTGLNIRIAVRSVDGLADAPLFSVSSVVAALGPNQSKEIRTDLNSSVQASAIPDWQSLRTEVLIARQ
jgi:hypothetical protein